MINGIASEFLCTTGERLRTEHIFRQLYCFNKKKSFKFFYRGPVFSYWLKMTKVWTRQRIFKEKYTKTQDHPLTAYIKKVYILSHSWVGKQMDQQWQTWIFHSLILYFFLLLYIFKMEHMKVWEFLKYIFHFNSHHNQHSLLLFYQQ